MIRYESQKQLTLESFETPFEMTLDPSNRWVRYARGLPWDDLAKVYIRKMSSQKGAGAKDPRIVIGALFIKHITKLSDEDTIETIKENIYMQYFLGLSGYTYKRVFDPSLFVHIRKRLGIQEFNEFTILLEECAEQRREESCKRQASQTHEDKSIRMTLQARQKDPNPQSQRPAAGLPSARPKRQLLPTSVQTVSNLMKTDANTKATCCWTQPHAWPT